MSTRTDLLLTRAGISYRQFDWYCRKGWIRQRFQRRNGEAVEHGKSGYRRDIPAEEEPVVLLMGRLVKAGIKPETAAFVARNAEDHDDQLRCVLGPGMEIVIRKWVAE